MHQGVLHVLFDFGYHVDVIDKEPVKKVLGNVASIETFARRLAYILFVNSLYNRELFCIFEY